MTLKLGWCLSNQHTNDMSIPEYQRCPGEVWSHICPCECHNEAPPPQRPMPLNPPQGKKPAPEPKKSPKPPVVKRPAKQRRKLL